MTVRQIVADCQSEDGSQLIITTEYQGEANALSFKIEGADDDGRAVVLSVRVSYEDLAELMGFQDIERGRYRAQWATADQIKEPF